MQFLLYRLRFVFFLVLVLGVTGGIVYFMSQRTFEQDLARYNLQVTAGVATGIHTALLDVTRTAEAPLNRFRVVRLPNPADLEAVARENQTTLELIQMVNGLAPDVTEGHGEVITVPVNVTELDPPRQITRYRAQPGDTLDVLARTNLISLELIRADNPVLAQRGVQAGDIVFIALVL